MQRTRKIFVDLTEGQFVEKASDILANNFHSVVEKPKRVKERAKGLLQELHLYCLSRAVTKAEGFCIDVFFSMKTHQPEQPFRTIVFEKGMWQLVVSMFLQKQLERLKVEDP